MRYYSFSFVIISEPMEGSCYVTDETILTRVVKSSRYGPLSANLLVLMQPVHCHTNGSNLLEAQEEDALI